GGIALVVAVFVIVMALVAGLRRAITISGSPDNVVLVRKGATTETVSGVGKDQFDALKFLSAIRRDEDGNPLASPELAIQEFFDRTGGGRDNIVVRGVLPVALKVHEKVHVVEGRMFKPSVKEVIVGKQLVGRYQGCELGSTIKFGRNKWKVVGIFEADGSTFESEAWSDLHDLQGDARRGDTFSAARVKAVPGADLGALKKRAQDDPRINLDASTEPEYYAAQSLVANQMRALGVVVAVVMAIGAIFGAMNTMYAAVAGRTAEIGTLRALGFNPGSVMGSFVIESLLLAVSAGIVGVIIALPINGLSTSMGNSMTFSTMAFSFRVTPAIALEALLFAAVMGVLGGLLPARQAMRMRVVDALRRA
ncbi:MAG TPA: FtsX-like permease family protein, partial [Candidatus Binataceae bacterium]